MVPQYSYRNEDIDPEINFIDIEGPDGMVSYRDAMRALQVWAQVDRLATFISERHGGPMGSETAIEAAMRIMTEQRDEIEARRKLEERRLDDIDRLENDRDTLRINNRDLVEREEELRLWINHLTSAVTALATHRN